MWTIPHTAMSIWPLAGTMLLNGVCEVAMKPITPGVLATLGISDMEHGLVVTAFSFAKLMSNEPSAWVANSVGRRAAMVLGLAIQASGVLLLSRATDYVSFGLARSIQGCGNVLVGMGKTLAASDLATTSTRATTQAPLYAAFKVGAVVGPVLGGSLAVSYGDSKALTIVALFYALAACLTRCWVTETRGRERPVEQSVVTPAVYRLCAVNAASWFAINGAAMAVVPKFLGAHGRAATGRFYLAEAVVGILAPLVVARVADGVGPETLLAPALLLAAAANMVFLLGNITVAMALAAIPAAVVFPSLRAALLNIVPARSSALARFQVAGDAALMLGSLTLSWISASFGYDAVFLFLGLWLVLCAIAVAWSSSTPVSTAATPSKKE